MSDLGVYNLVSQFLVTGIDKHGYQNFDASNLSNMYAITTSFHKTIVNP